MWRVVCDLVFRHSLVLCDPQDGKVHLPGGLLKPETVRPWFRFWRYADEEIKAATGTAVFRAVTGSPSRSVKPLDVGLRKMGQRKFAEQVRHLRIYGRCPCGLLECEAFYCVSPEEMNRLAGFLNGRYSGVTVAKGRSSKFRRSESGPGPQEPVPADEPEDGVMEMRSTPPRVPIERRDTETLPEDLCIALRNVALWEYDLPRGQRVLEQIEEVKSIHAELVIRESTLMIGCGDCPRRECGEMTMLLKECLTFPAAIPYVRGATGIRGRWGAFSAGKQSF